MRGIVSKYERNSFQIWTGAETEYAWWLVHFSKTSLSAATLTCKWRDGCRELFFYSINSSLVDSRPIPTALLPSFNRIGRRSIAICLLRTRRQSWLLLFFLLYKYEWQRSSSWAINYTCTHPLRSHKNPFQPLGRGWKKWNGIENGEGWHQTWNYICF